ncbi:phosphate regulon sensor histidine kinase PhoR [Thioalkalivibrio sp. ALE16]|uniref:phosphate regulon sensor histidine kinase PhoR n=1 Tax=Thioalkalivibrio sp. ALE16 TaxID=1158172 RepID=UPI000381123C|nr:phosphate regulon sensor histidine kinase PhoR [Thioalkalivibrio sp. ALE16]
MQPRKTWPDILITSLLIALPILALGWATGQFWPTVAFLLGAALAWNIANLLWLETWLRRGGRAEPPDVRGLWGVIFDQLYRRRKRHENRVHRLRQLLERYRDSARAMPDAVVVLNDDLRIEWINDMACQLLGLEWPRDEGQRITHLLRHPEFLTFMERARESLARVTVPSPLDDERQLEMRMLPYGDAQYLLLARDTTHLHRLEVMRRDFIANVSHELRTPLTVLYGVTETLEDALEDQPELTRSVQMLREQSERMKLLVDDLLLLSRLETGETTGPQDWFNPLPMLQKLTEEARLLSGTEAHRIVLDADPTLEFRGNPDELRSACANLIFNAVKYTPGGTTITLKWRADPDGARLIVEDTGPGIASHHLGRLTERFYRVDAGRTQSRGGTGLGLAIVKHVLARHDGHLAIESQVGQGSRFTCLFPLSRIRHAEAADLSSQEDPAGA